MTDDATEKQVAIGEFACATATSPKRKRINLNESIAFYTKPISELRSVTCHMGLYTVTYHLTQINAPPLNPNWTDSFHLPQGDGRRR